ncbi:P-II family nitrogen regulator [Geobacter sp.]|uniref:P-II family nitrogen regulator n=1 Tax=Geobacter sp. TaxID=46610 RepID=UPI00261A0764|nr:P-II family nitrogen regulator [Geobacter sp.]
MELRTVVAIIRNEVLEKVEGRLVDMGVKGISVTKVKGYGEYANFFNPDWMVSHSRIEIFTERSRVDETIAAIMELAHTSMPGDGVVAVLPVEKLYRIRTRSEALPEEI